jgi:heme a synthase
MPRSFINPWLHRWAVLTAAATFGLVGVGGLVTSHGVGMAVPDWPNTYGYNMFFFPISKWVGGIFYEHSHRLLASGVGLLTSVLALWLYGKSARRFLRWSGLALLAAGVVTLEAVPGRWSDGTVLVVTGLVSVIASFGWPGGEAAPKWLRWLGLAAFFAVVLQGILGGLRVVLFKDQIGVFHAALAQLFFVLICAIALFTSRWWQGIDTGKTQPGWPRPLRASTFWLLSGTTALIMVQLVLGATMRHQHAGLAIPDFPLAYGKIWPDTDPQAIALYNQQRIEVMVANPITSLQVVLQMVHRLVAAAIWAAVAVCAWLVRRQLGPKSAPAKLTVAWLMLVLGQVALGAATIWSNKAADIATAHVVVGALSLATGAIVCIVGTRYSEPGRHWVFAPGVRVMNSSPPMGDPAQATGING